MEPNLTLPEHRSMSTKGHDLYNFLELQTKMLHAKFQGNWPSGSVEEDF